MPSHYDNLSDEQLLEVARSRGIDTAAFTPSSGGAGEVDPSEGAPFLSRLGGSFKSSPQDKFKYYEKVLGQGNVSLTQGGDIVWKKPGEQRWHPIDEPGFAMADIADFAGDVPEMVGMGAGAVVGAGAASVPGAMVGAAAGNVVKQAIGAMLPGEVEARPLGRLGEVATAGATAGIAQKGGNLLLGGIRKLRGAGGGATEAVGAAIRKTNDPALLAEGLSLEKEVGGQLLPSQLTGNRVYSLIEGFQKRNPFAAQAFEEFVLEKQMRPVAQRASRIMEQITSKEVSDVSLGGAFKETMEKSIETALHTTRSQAAKDFGPLRAMGGMEPRVTLDNYTAGLEELIKMGKPEFGGQASRMARDAQKILRSLQGGELLQGLGTRPGVAVNPQKLQDMLANLGAQAYGKAPDMFSYLPRSMQREISQDLHKLLRVDLEIAAEQGTGIGAKMLRSARSNYEKNINNVHALQDSLLSKFLRGKPEQFGAERTADWVMRLAPSELKATLAMLETTNPSLQRMLQRNVMERALAAGMEAAETGTVQFGVKPGRFSFNAFVEALPQAEKMKTIFGEPVEGIARDIARLMQFAERAAAMGKAGSIQEPAPRALLRIALNPLHFARIATVFSPRVSLELFTNKELRRVLLGAVEKPSPQAQSALMAALEKYLPLAFYETMRSGEQQPANQVPVQ